MPVNIFPLLASLVPQVAGAAEREDQSATPGAGTRDLTGGDNEDILAQTVTAGLTGPLTKVRLPVGCPSPTEPLTIEIRTLLESGMPSDTVLRSESYFIAS